MTQRVTHGAKFYEEMQKWLAESRDSAGKLLRHNQIAALVNEITRLRDEIRGIHTVAQVAKPKLRRVAKKAATKKAVKNVATKKR
jgi:hypothetical protein